MEDNPAHAMAIAAGLVPEPGMPKLFADNVKGKFFFCYTIQNILTKTIGVDIAGRKTACNL